AAVKGAVHRLSTGVAALCLSRERIELAESHPDRTRPVRKISSCYQPFGGNLRSVAAHDSRDGSSTRSDIRSERALERAGERIGRWRTGRLRSADSERVDSLCPVVLVIVIRNDHLRSPGERG